MRFFYLCYENLNEPRGGARHVTEVVRSLSRAGHDVELFVPTLPPAGTFDTPVHSHVIHTPSIRVIGWGLFYFFSALVMLRSGWKARPDILYVREMVYNLAPIVVSRLIRCPLIIEINGPLLDEMRMIGAGRVELGLIRLSQKLSFRSADRLVVVAEGLGDRIRELYSLSPEKIMVIPNGTDPDRVKPVDMEESQRSIGLTPGPVVGFLGSCYPYHDIDTLINAAPAIISRNPEVRFLIVGDGYMRPAWMARVEKEGLAGYFVFTGAVPFEEVPRHVSAFTVCIALFASESGEKMNRSPMKLYDYMACARPTVATDLPGNGDVIRTWKAGLAIPPGDASALAEAVNRLLGDSALCAEMGKNGRNAVEEYFSWQRVVADIVRTVEMIRDQKR